MREAGAGHQAGQGAIVEAEMTIEFLRRGFRLSWVPCAYLPRYGESKLRPLQDGIDILRTMVRTRLRPL